MGNAPTIILHATLAVFAPVFSTEIAEKDPWIHVPGIVIADEIGGGFTSKYSSSDHPDSVSRLTAQISDLEKTSSSLSLISSEALEAITEHLRADIRSDSVNAEDPIGNIQEVKRLTGFNWAEISKLINVDRRSIYNWLQGGLIRDRNTKRIAMTLSAIRFIDEGSAEDNKKKLLETSDRSYSLYELLSNAQFDEVNFIARHGKGRATEGWAPQDKSFVAKYGLALEPEGFVVADDSFEAQPLGDPITPTSKRRKARKV